MDQPLVSVVIPAFNSARYLAQAIESALSQDYDRLDVIVVDDGSTDNSAEIAAGYAGVRVVRQANQGNAGAKNTGLAEARGELVAFLDADDYWLPGKVRRQAAGLTAQPHLAYALCHGLNILEEGADWPPGFPVQFRNAPEPTRMPSALMAWAETFRRVGPFDPTYLLSNDFEWFMRVKDAGREYVMLPETLFVHRFHGGNLTYLTARVAREALRALHASTRRQRGAAPGDSAHAA